MTNNLTACTQGMDRSRKTARTANQPSQGVSQLGIVGFDRISVAFFGVRAPLAGEVDERFVDRECIGIMLFCLERTVEHALALATRDRSPFLVRLACTSADIPWTNSVVCLIY